MTGRQVTRVLAQQLNSPPVVYDNEVLITTIDGNTVAIPANSIAAQALTMHTRQPHQIVVHHVHSGRDSGLDFVELDKKDEAIWRMAARRNMEHIFYEKPEPRDFHGIDWPRIFVLSLGLGFLIYCARHLL